MFLCHITKRYSAPDILSFYVFAICEPTMNEPAPAQVAAIDMAYQSGGFDLNLSLIRENTFEPSSC